MVGMFSAICDEQKRENQGTINGMPDHTMMINERPEKGKSGSHRGRIRSCDDDNGQTGKNQGAIDCMTHFYHVTCLRNITQ